MKGIYKVIGGAILVTGLLTACGEVEEPKVVEETQTEETVEEKEVQEEVKTEFAIGEKIQVGDLAFTVSGIEKSQGSQWDKPKAGHEYIIVSIDIENTGNAENISYNPLFEFEMQNSKGQITGPSFSMIDTDTNLTAADLAPGGYVSGTAVFEQPIDDPDLTFLYTVGYWSDNVIKVKLQ